MKLVFEIAGFVGLVVVPESGRLIQHRGAGGEDAGSTLNCRVQSGGVNKGLEDGAWLALGQDVVELADTVVAPAGQRFDFAGMRVERDQRALRFGNRLALEALLLAD